MRMISKTSGASGDRSTGGRARRTDLASGSMPNGSSRSVGTTLSARPKSSSNGKRQRGAASELITTRRPVTPADVLKERILKGQRITQDQLAKAMGVTRYSVNQLMNNRRGVTAAMALRLARATSTTPEFWLDLQRDVDLFDARIKLERTNELDRVEVVRPPIPDGELYCDND
jgi:addiction module HigA family antidote